MIDSKNRKKFVVGVIGTQNTGKSTFIRDILYEFSETSMEFKTVGCDYRKKIEEAGLSINRNGNLKSQRVIMDTLLEQLDMIVNEMPSGNYIMDRTPIDAYVYTIYLKRHNPELGITDKDLDDFLRNVVESMPKYDRIIFFDLDDCMNIDVVDDKFRDTDLDYRREIDAIFKEVVQQVDRNKIVFRGIKGTREERVEAFLETQCAGFEINSEYEEIQNENKK